MLGEMLERRYGISGGVWKRRTVEEGGEGVDEFADVGGHVVVLELAVRNRPFSPK